jgi:hypothetical protein
MIRTSQEPAMTPLAEARRITLKEGDRSALIASIARQPKKALPMTKLLLVTAAAVAALLLLTTAASLPAYAAPNSDDQIAFTRVPDHTLYCNMNNTGETTILEVRPSRWEVVKIDDSNKAETLVIRSGGFVPGTRELGGIRFGDGETLA